MESSIPELPGRWRDAERRWERSASPEQVRAAGLDVVEAWCNYQNASLSHDTDEFMLIADDDGTYVAATSGVRRVLAYEPVSLVGRRIADITAPAILDQAPGDWQRFLVEGRQDGEYLLLDAQGGVVKVRYQARAHHPIPGFHVSRLWPCDPAEQT